ncbi:fluoride efflux transporter CrcB [Flavilitoribacter nigricans]|uniref:Fluoride-specific ion channel FluC n=1 Tax=Flavilitoribacter nigricans (strain ATCC 23147 / DSM 23189 / NBRC 102662 / NCIMB 1420 / SS-2) TaxID=1122177 RepID=A0A2D0NCS6_FLAN2|nr:fluoride efflux transporter CrcB [Flavilitoribacter nigricans]PHN05573.1 fluoride efflux transporter CrcB [Flavilitoribacter nigricans DSM 23189 = NBRC 102662]
MLNFLFVFIGGGLGSMCRYGIARGMAHYKLNFPLATFTANVLACIILGYLISLKSGDQVSGNTQLLIMTGFCGGFSTFSTFTAETHLLFQEGAYGQGLFYVGASLVVCLLSLYLGTRLGLR